MFSFIRMLSYKCHISVKSNSASLEKKKTKNTLGRSAVNLLSYMKVLQVLKYTEEHKNSTEIMLKCC